MLVRHILLSVSKITPILAVIFYAINGSVWFSLRHMRIFVIHFIIISVSSSSFVVVVAVVVIIIIVIIIFTIKSEIGFIGQSVFRVRTRNNIMCFISCYVLIERDNLRANTSNCSPGTKRKAEFCKTYVSGPKAINKILLSLVIFRPVTVVACRLNGTKHWGRDKMAAI